MKTKLKLRFFMLAGIAFFALSACSIPIPRSPEDTATGRAAYGDVMPEYKAHKKKNARKKKRPLKRAKRNPSRDAKLYGHGRPY